MKITVAFVVLVGLVVSIGGCDLATQTDIANLRAELHDAEPEVLQFIVEITAAMQTIDGSWYGYMIRDSRFNNTAPWFVEAQAPGYPDWWYVVSALHSNIVSDIHSVGFASERCTFYSPDPLLGWDFRFTQRVP